MATKIKSYRAPVWKKGTNNAGTVLENLENMVKTHTLIGLRMNLFEKTSE